MPMPQTGVGRKPGRPRGSGKYPWSELRVGDAIHFKHPKDRASLLTIARLWCKDNGKDWLFSSRVIDGDVYIWRIQ